jgi:hypothetical protein
VPPFPSSNETELPAAFATATSSQPSALKSPTAIPRAAPTSEMSMRGLNVPFPFPSRIETPDADALAVTRSRWSSSST